MYIRQSKLKHLKEYQYSGVDHSLVSRYILKPFYTKFVIHLFPLSMAPNLITLTGFFFIVLNLLTLLYYNPTLSEDCPRWVYASWSLGLFLYQTFDACDGTQARRTGQSGPLGELFDHGVDALNTTLGSFIFAAAVNLGYSWETVLIVFASLCAFYLTTWEEYHTGTLYLGLVSGPVEGVLTLCAVYAATAVVGGGSFWQRPLHDVLGARAELLPEPVRDWSLVRINLVYGGIMLGFNIIQSSLNVVSARRNKNLPVLPALAGLLPFFVPWALTYAYLRLTPLVLTRHLLPFLFFTGVAFAYQVGLMITAHLTKSPFPFRNILTLPLVFGVLDAVGPVLHETYGFGWRRLFGGENYEVAFVMGCVGLAVGVHGSFVVDVVTNICDYLDIWCLRIKHPKVPLGQPAPVKESKKEL